MKDNHRIMKFSYTAYPKVYMLKKDKVRTNIFKNIYKTISDKILQFYNETFQCIQHHHQSVRKKEFYLKKYLHKS